MSNETNQRSVALRPREGLFRKFLESNLTPEDRLQRRLGSRVAPLVKEGRAYRDFLRREQVKEGVRKSGIIFQRTK